MKLDALHLESAKDGGSWIQDLELTIFDLEA
jgi:hypothetical protein